MHSEPVLFTIPAAAAAAAASFRVTSQQYFRARLFTVATIWNVAPPTTLKTLVPRNYLGSFPLTTRASPDDK